MTTDLESSLRHFLKIVLIEVAHEVFPRYNNPLPKVPLFEKPDDKMLLRASDTAKRLAISARYLHSLTRSGKLPHVRVGRLIRYRVDTLRQWIANIETTEWPKRETISPRSESRTRRSRSVATPKRSISKKDPVRVELSRTQSPAQSHDSGRPHASRGAASQSHHRPVIKVIANQLGVSEESFPRMTYGELCRIAGVDLRILHQWEWHGGEMPDSVLTRLHEHFAEYFTNRGNKTGDRNG